MFAFRLEREIPLLVVTRTGFWSLEMVADYEAALRRELAGLQQYAGPTACIVDIGSVGAQSAAVAEALRALVERLGPLGATRTAVVSQAGLARLQANRVADGNSRAFESMALAREWAIGQEESAPSDMRADACAMR